MTTSTFTDLGSVTEGEVPEPWVESWDTYDGDNLPMSGMSATVKFKVNGGTQTSRSADVNTAVSTTTVTWLAADYDEAGLMAGEVIATDGTNTYKRSFQRVILPARGGV
jgi:hypothetical protein